MHLFFMQLVFVWLVSASEESATEEKEVKKSIVNNSFLCNQYPSLCVEVPYVYNPEGLLQRQTKKAMHTPPTMCDFYPKLCKFRKMEGFSKPSLYFKKASVYQGKDSEKPSNKRTLSDISTNEDIDEYEMTNQKRNSIESCLRHCVSRKCVSECFGLLRVY